MNICLRYPIMATIALAASSALVVTGQEANKNPAVTRIGKAPALPEDKAKKIDALPAGVYFSDSFSGSQLAPEWKVMNGDAQGWTMQPKQKSLLIISKFFMLLNFFHMFLS